MPFYEYQCRACGDLTEVLQKVSDPPLRKCPGCGKNQLTKLVSAPVFRLKGGGWYETDFKSDGENKRNLVGEKEEAKPAEAKAEGKSEAKTETKAEPKSDAKPEAKAKSKPKPVSKPAAKPVRAAAKRAATPKRAAPKARR